MTTYTLSLQEIGKDDFQVCGGKGANLGELTQLGARVPPGYCIVAAALQYLIGANSLAGRIAAIAEQLDFDDFEGVEEATARIRALIAEADIPADLGTEIRERYRALVAGGARDVAGPCAVTR